MLKATGPVLELCQDKFFTHHPPSEWKDSRPPKQLLTSGMTCDRPVVALTSYLLKMKQRESKRASVGISNGAKPFTYIDLLSPLSGMDDFYLHLQMKYREIISSFPGS